MIKEIPSTTEKNWYGEKEHVSKRLIIETAWMKKYFKIGQWHRLPTPATNWDRPFLISPTEMKLQRTNDRTYPLAWSLKFAMSDNNYLSNPNLVWTAMAFYPGSRSYPANEPVTALVDDRGHVLYGDKNQGTVNIGGVNYCHACLGSYWEPSTDHAAIALVRAIEWLRSCLYSKKTGFPMPHYV